MSLRTERIGEQLRAEIARVLRERVTDPRVGLLTLTRIDVSPDLSNAIVYWSPLQPRSAADLEEISNGLASGAGFVRRQLAATLALRRMPELRFKHDPSIEEGSQILALLSTLADKRDPEEEHDE